MKLFSSFRRSMTAQRRYFAESGPEIAARNMELVHTVSAIGMVFYILYYTVTLLFFPSLSISPLYGLFVVVLAGFFAGSGRALRKPSLSVRGAHAAVLGMYIVLMIDVILMSIFPHRNLPSAYYPLFLLIGPVLFLLPVCEQITVNLCSAALFFPLVFLCKDPSCWQHELFEAFTSLLLSFAVILILMRLRVQSETLKDKYRADSTLDQSTGVLNKSGGTEEASLYFREGRRQEPCAVFFVDLDDFKKANDTYGHLEGDRRLKAAAAALRGLCRSSDLVCRFGGDEFLVILKAIAPAGLAAQKADAMLEAIRTSSEPDARTFTCSVGICYIDFGVPANLEDAVRTADQALYQAKQAGKNRYVLTNLARPAAV